MRGASHPWACRDRSVRYHACMGQVVREEQRVEEDDDELSDDGDEDNDDNDRYQNSTKD